MRPEPLEVVREDAGLRFRWEDESDIIVISPARATGPFVDDTINVWDVNRKRPRVPFSLDGLNTAIDRWLRQNDWVFDEKWKEPIKVQDIIPPLLEIVRFRIPGLRIIRAVVDQARNDVLEIEFAHRSRRGKRYVFRRRALIPGEDTGTTCMNLVRDLRKAIESPKGLPRDGGPI